MMRNCLLWACLLYLWCRKRVRYRKKCDTRKSQICKEKGIQLLEIPNSFVKSYETLKELILSSCGQKVEQLELF